MQVLHERIRRDGRVLPGDVLAVGSFLNHQLDAALLDELGAEFYRRFDGAGVQRILTVEASGIALACFAARHFRVPAVFAKKARSSNLPAGVYSAPVHSYTHSTEYQVHVAREFLPAGERVLIIDDFLAHGAALDGLARIVEKAGCTLAGAGIAIEKGFQGGGDRLRSGGVRVESLAIVDAMEPDGSIRFRGE